MEVEKERGRTLQCAYCPLPSSSFYCLLLPAICLVFSSLLRFHLASAFCLLLTAFFPLLSSLCSLPFAFCSLPSAFCFLLSSPWTLVSRLHTFSSNPFVLHYRRQDETSRNRSINKQVPEGSPQNPHRVYLPGGPPLPVFQGTPFAICETRTSAQVCCLRYP